MLTTELCLIWYLFVNTEVHTHVPKFYVVFPILIRVRILFNCAVCQFMDEDMKDLIWGTTQTHDNLSSFVRVVSHRTVHRGHTCDGNTSLQHMKLLVICVCDVLPENFILLFDLNELLWFLGDGEYIRIDNEEYK